MTIIEPENLNEVTIDEVTFRLTLLGSQPLGTQVVNEYSVTFAVPWQFPRTDYLLGRSGKLPKAAAEMELNDELRFRGEYGWRLRANKTFRGRDQWMTRSQEPYDEERGLSVPSADAGLRWLFFCACFYRLRPYHGVGTVYEFFSAAEQLANRGEPLHAPKVCHELCGFAPEQSVAWQVYQESNRGPDTYEKAFDGPESAARNFMRHLDDDITKNEILFDPRNVIRKVALYAK